MWQSLLSTLAVLIHCFIPYFTLEPAAKFHFFRYKFFFYVNFYYLNLITSHYWAFCFQNISIVVN